MNKYSKNRRLGPGKDRDGKKKKRDETDVLAALNSFRGMLKSDRDSHAMDVDDRDGAEAEGAGGEEGIEVDRDHGFMNHLLEFPKDNNEEVEKAERDYEVIDPRQRGARAKQEERDRKNAASKGKGRGKRW